MLVALATLLLPAAGARAQDGESTDAAAALAPTVEEPETQPENLTEDQADPLAALGSVFEDTPAWAWLVLFIGILGGLVAGKFVQGLLRRLAGRLRERGESARSVVFDALAGPASLALLTFGIKLGLYGLAIPPELSAFAASVIKFLFILAIGWCVYNFVDLIDIALTRHLEKSQSKLAAQLVPLIRKAFRIFVVIVFVLFIAQNVFGVNITAWIAGLGIAGLAISLASQDSIRNLFGSITVMLDKPFALGDRIVFAGTEGFVEEIGLRSTRIRTFAGHLVTMPNMKFIDGSVENVSKRSFIRRSLNVTITYDTPPQEVNRAVQLIKDILAEEDMAAPFRIGERPPRVFFNDFNADSLNISVSYWYFLDPAKGHDWWNYQAHAETFNTRLLTAFNEAGIDFAFPTQTLYLAGDADRELSVRMLPQADTP